MAKELVLRVVALLCGHKRRVGRLYSLLREDKRSAGGRRISDV